MATSPAQQCFRDFKAECNEMKRLTVQALLAGENYTYEEVIDFFAPILEGYRDCLSEIEDVSEIWDGRGEEYAAFCSSEVIRKYTEKREEQSEEDSSSIGDSEPDRILGFPIISPSACLSAGGRVRGQVSLTIDELAEYLAPVPVSAIAGIVVVYGKNGEVKGFSLCGLKNS